MSRSASAASRTAGSVGIPYEGRPAAFWLIMDGTRPRLRETPYNVEAAIDERVVVTCRPSAQWGN